MVSVLKPSCRGALFFASPGRWCEFGVTMKLSRWYQVPIDGRKLTCQDKAVKMASKKQGTRASARSPIDSVSAAGFVRVQQNLISGLKLTLIDFWG